MTRLGAQSVTLLNTLRDPTQLRQHQCAPRQQHPPKKVQRILQVFFFAVGHTAKRILERHGIQALFKPRTQNHPSAEGWFCVQVYL